MNKREKIATIFALTMLLLSNAISHAQIEDGSIAPNFYGTDMSGETHELYSYLEDNKYVVIYFIATWSDPCWSDHNGAWNGTAGTGAMNQLYNDHGTDNGGIVEVLMVEGDSNTNDYCVIDEPGCNYTTHGNWTQDNPVPIINNASIANQFGITEYPTVMTICPSGAVFETGTQTAASHWSFIQTLVCPALPQFDAGLQFSSDDVLSCEISEIVVNLVNLGSEEINNLTIVSEGGTPEINLDWTGSLESFDTEELNFGEISVNEGEELVISIVESDDNMDNNSIAPAIASIPSTTHIRLELQSDLYPEDFSFYILNANNEVVISDGAWGGLGQNALIIEDYYLPETGCYTVWLYDSYGDGLFEGAYCQVYGLDAEGVAMQPILDIQPGEFSEVMGGVNANELIVNIHENELELDHLEIYPNPAFDSIHLSFELNQPGNTFFELIDPSGKLVFSQSLGGLGTGKHNHLIEISDVAAGFYQVFLTCNNKRLGTRLKVE